MTDNKIRAHFGAEFTFNIWNGEGQQAGNMECAWDLIDFSLPHLRKIYTNKQFVFCLTHTFHVTWINVSVNLVSWNVLLYLQIPIISAEHLTSHKYLTQM